MKKFYLFLLMGITLNAFSQTYVSTVPMNKNAMIEEFTGVQCPNCPAGHTTAAQILAANPGRAWIVCFHPYNSSYTTPYSGNPDFRRHFGDSLYMTPYCGTSRYMPSAFINRRLWSPPERLNDRTTWNAHCNSVLAESSPLNIGMASTYDLFGRSLQVTVEVYFTANTTSSYSLMVTLAENGLVAQQASGGATYLHNHVFREAFTGQWGDLLATAPVQGTLVTRNFNFDNSTMLYGMGNCELVAYVIDNSTQEVVSAIGAPVNSTTVGLDSHETAAAPSVQVYPNPLGDRSVLEIFMDQPRKAEFRIFNAQGKIVLSRDLGRLDKGLFRYDLGAAVTELTTGIYFLQVKAGDRSYTQKLILE